MAHVLIAGGGLAGLASAAALGGGGHRVTVLEAKPFLGGRAASYALPASDGAEIIDNCQHILLRCCVNLLDFYRRLGVERAIRFHREFTFIEPGGRVSVMKAGRLPAPAHLLGSFLNLRFLSPADKLAVVRALFAIERDWRRRSDLDCITMLDWLREQRQTPRAIERFWRQALVSAINEELDRMAARHGIQVMQLGFLARADAYEMGVPDVPLGSLYAAEAWSEWPGVEIRTRTSVTRVAFGNERVEGFETERGRLEADHYISALPVERLQTLAPHLGVRWEAFEPAPITGIHLWFDRKVTDLPHATLLDRTIQWFFNKGEGRYLQLVVSASRDLLKKGKTEIVELARGELAEFLPAVRGAELVKAHVVKEARATFSACPRLEAERPGAETRYANFSLAGDWTRSGWPATMEGAVRSGYLAAEAACRAVGEEGRFLLEDIG